MIKEGAINYGGEVFGPIPSNEDFELIKEYVSPDTKKEDVFVYKVRLCDNNKDRDLERFTDKALQQLANLYIGKIGIEDHQPSSKNSHSRIYKTEVVRTEEQNDEGKPYEYLLGYAYTINNSKNSAIIADIKAGLKKEVSVGISNKDPLCSICGEPVSKGHCIHKKGSIYEDKECIGLIDDVDDVYEWSFVAVPAQRKAGVIKQYKKEDKEESKMTLKEAVAKVLKSTNAAPEDVKALMDEVERAEEPERTYKALEEENASLKSQLQKALKELEEDKVRRTEEYIDSLIDSLRPENDKMRALARKAIEELIEVDTDGKLTTESERKIKEELESDEYRPLFKKEEEEDKERLEDKEEREEASKSYSKNKGLSFTPSTSTAYYNSKSYQKKEGVMGIRYRDKN